MPIKFYSDEYLSDFRFFFNESKILEWSPQIKAPPGGLAL